VPYVADIRPQESAARAGRSGPEPIVLATRPFTGTPGPLAVAQWLAVREGRPLHLVSVLEPAGSTSVAGDVPLIAPQYYEEERSAIVSRIFEALQRTQYAHLDTRVELVDGSVPQAVTRVARDRDASLLVLGTGGMGGLRHGRIAQQILRTAKVPVLLVPPDATAQPIRRAVAAVDFSASSLRAANAVLPLLAEGGHLTLCHVKTAFHPGEADVATFDREYALRCEELFGRFVRSLALVPGVTVTTKLLHGAAVPQINEFLRQDNADILVCGRRSHGFVERLLLGSVSSALVRQARIPVLVAPEMVEDENVPVNAIERSGVEHWPSDGWATLLHIFTQRHRGERVRIELSADADGDPCTVAQGYELLDVSYEPDGSRVSLTLGDPWTTQGQMSLWIPEVRSLALESSLAGADRRLVMDSGRGHGILRLADDSDA